MHTVMQMRAIAKSPADDGLLGRFQAAPLDHVDDVIAAGLFVALGDYAILADAVPFETALAQTILARLPGDLFVDQGSYRLFLTLPDESVVAFTARSDEPVRRAKAPRPPEMKVWLAVRKEKPRLDPVTGENLAYEIDEAKLAGQAMHAAHWLTGLVMTTNPALMERYNGGPFVDGRQPTTGTPKIVVKAKNLAMLERIEREARAAGIPCVSVTDDGRTVFNGVKTKTVVAFGPAYEHELPKYLQGLQFLKVPHKATAHGGDPDAAAPNP